MLAGLPAAVYIDVRALTEDILLRQARDAGAVITNMRDFYASDVVARVLAHDTETQVLHTYKETPGAIPIPATLSLEMGRLIQQQGQSNIGYRFISDYPFANRKPHDLDAFERDSLARLRAKLADGPLVRSTFSGLTGQVRVITPVVMGSACVDCHNSHPDSPRQDWAVGDVRAIQEVTVALPLAESLGAFRSLLVYFVLSVVAGAAIIAMRLRIVTLRARERAADAANRAKTGFLAVMSHEIRTPMNAVLGLAASLRDEPLSRGQREAVTEILSSGDELMRILNEILDFSKTGRDGPRPDTAAFSPAGLSREIIRAQGPNAGAKALSLTFDIDGGVPDFVGGDQGRVRQILVNLISNAIKFTDTGSVTVVLRQIELRDLGAVLEWSVADSGIGIAADQLDRVFQMFVQADSTITRRYGGTGMGLAICRKLVAGMGGTIAVESWLGQGSVFRVVIPFADVPDQQTPNQTADPDPAGTLHVLLSRHRGLKILLAEDNVVNRLVVTRLLEPFDVRIDSAGTGIEAVRLAATRRYDVIFMDMVMPDMDGLKATRTLRAAHGPNRETPIIALTANVYPEDVAACHAAGMTHFIAKPLRREALLTALIQSLKESAAHATIAADDHRRFAPPAPPRHPAPPPPVPIPAPRREPRTVQWPV